MKKISFIHCADIHMDAPFTLFGRHDKSHIRREDIKVAFTKIIDLAEQKHIDLLLISGDLYEYKFSRKSTIDFINRQFARIPDVRIVIIPGNHDPDAPNSFYNTIKWNNNVHILNTSNNHVYFGDIDTHVFGAGYINDESDIDILADKASSSSFNIMLFHGSIDMPFDNAFNAVSSKVLGRPEFDYIATGHVHTVFKEAGPHKNIYSPGCPEPLAFDQTGNRGVYLGTIIDNSSKQVDVEFIKLNSKFYENLELDVSNMDFQDIEQTLNEIMVPYDMKDGLFNLTLKGYIDKDYLLDIEQLEESFQEKVFYIRINDETVPDFDFNELAAEPGIVGTFVEKMLKRIELIADEDQDEKETYINALYFGLEALIKGEVSSKGREYYTGLEKM